MCLILLKVELSAFTQVFFSSLSDVHEYLGSLLMTTSSLGKQTANCESPHNWLMSLPIDLAALSDMWRRKLHQWKWFSFFSDNQLRITTWLADKFSHGFSCFVWYVEVLMAPMEVIWLFVVNTAFGCHFVAQTLPSYGSASGIGYASKKLFS